MAYSGVASTSSFLRGDGTFATPTAEVTAPVVQPYAPGSFTVVTGKFTVMSRRLALTTSQRATLQGTATMRIT